MKLLSYASLNKDFKVEILKIEEENYNFELKIKSNSEIIIKKSESNTLYEICGVLFDEIIIAGKVTEISIKNKVYNENEIKNVNFKENSADVVVNLKDKKVLHTSMNELEIKTDCFGEDDYEEDIQELRREVDRLYEANLITSVA